MFNLIGNYAKIAIRNLMRNKVYSALNILGLGIAMSCCLLIVLFLQRELQYDHRYEKGDRIYKVVREINIQGGSRNFSWGTSGSLGPALQRDFPEVESAVRIWPWNVKVERENILFPTRLNRVDKHVFDVFEAEFVQGSAQTAFEDPTSIVITERMANVIYGEENPMGKVLTVVNSIFGGDYIVRGVLKDRLEPTTIPFNMFVSRDANAQWRNKLHSWDPAAGFRPVQTYILLQEGVSPKTLEQKFPDFITRYMGAEIQKYNAYHLQPLHRVYLHSRADYDIQELRRYRSTLYDVCDCRIYSDHCLRELYESGDSPISPARKRGGLAKSGRCQSRSVDPAISGRIPDCRLSRVVACNYCRLGNAARV